MNVVLFGSNGMLGSDIRLFAPSCVSLLTFNRAEIDVTDRADVLEAITRSRPRVVINCAAYTNVDKAESESDLAFSVNGDGPANIGWAAREWHHQSRDANSTNAPVVFHFSTDYVFPGTSESSYKESDPKGPLNVYGESKLRGELALVRSGSPYVIIRTQWLFGETGGSFPRTMLNRATNRQTTRVVDDQFGKPTYTPDLANAVWSVVESVTNGDLLTAQGRSVRSRVENGVVMHLANDGSASWYDVARMIFDAVGAPELVSSCSSDEYPTPARRPARSVLDCSFARNSFDLALPKWQDALNRFMQMQGLERAT